MKGDDKMINLVIEFKNLKKDAPRSNSKKNNLARMAHGDSISPKAKKEHVYARLSKEEFRKC